MNDSYKGFGTMDFSAQDLMKMGQRGSLYPSSPGLTKPFDRRGTQQNESMAGLKVGGDYIISQEKDLKMKSPGSLILSDKQKYHQQKQK